MTHPFELTAAQLQDRLDEMVEVTFGDLQFVFGGNGPRDDFQEIAAKPFRFKMVVAADLKKSDWKFAGRSAESRRTITASVTQSGYDKMVANWIYMAPDVREEILGGGGSTRRRR